MSDDDFDDDFEDDDFEEDDFEDDADDNKLNDEGGGNKFDISNDDKNIKGDDDSAGDDFEQDDDDDFEHDDGSEDEDDFEDDDSSTASKSPPAAKKNRKGAHSGLPSASQSKASSNRGKIVNKIRTARAVSKAFKVQSMNRTSSNSSKLINKVRTANTVSNAFKAQSTNRTSSNSSKLINKVRTANTASNAFKAQSTKRALHTKTLHDNQRPAKTATGEPNKVKRSKEASAPKAPVTHNATKNQNLSDNSTKAKAGLTTSPSSRVKVKRVSGQNSKTKRTRKKKENWDPSSEVEQEARNIALAARKIAPPPSHVLARFGDWEMHRIGDHTHVHHEEGTQKHELQTHNKLNPHLQQSDPKYVFFNPRLNEKQKTTPANWPVDATGAGAPSRHGRRIADCNAAIFWQFFGDIMVKSIALYGVCVNPCVGATVLNQLYASFKRINVPQPKQCMER